ncbi:peptide chain release factor N(5)-glutamine methyltransferase [Xylocopilactobacillus apicola]|uniref:Release factor glutamine methyltransferase n=1 Tax=Xylocopilactobacillus apicola TaxID=2932184 RepID=A0AAU9D7H0_9LACO|nr:peptide chain release factor N(5)-glutamine methyltransferase [Xylocopilactobacillus apicola]BDR58265.1 release factor glutamine methyltransferase [Xylocopilactobacillus apicola]
MADYLVRDFLKDAKDKLSDQPVIADFIAADLLKISLGDLPFYYQHLMVHQDLANQWIKEYLAGKPYQYLTHQAYFFDLTFYVDENVLIPRPETEELVEWLLNLHHESKLKVLDLATGSGAIAVTVKKHRPNWDVTASDISKEALEVARSNAKSNQVKINVVESDLFSNLNERYDVIISNPPYIGQSEVSVMDQSVLNHEPKIALFAPDDGLYFYQKIYEEVANYLEPKGELLMEFGYQQKAKLAAIYQTGQIEFKKDLSGHDRMLRWQND